MRARFTASIDTSSLATRNTSLAWFDIPDHGAISLDDTERRDYDAFPSILYPEYCWWSIAHRLTYQGDFTYGHFREIDFSYEEWKSVLHLSTRWGFALIRTTIKPPMPHDRLLLARTYSVDDRVAPALSALCGRTAPPTLSDAGKMDIEDVVLVVTVRETIRSRSFQIKAAKISRHIVAAQAGILAGCEV